MNRKWILGFIVLITVAGLTQTPSFRSEAEASISTGENLILPQMFNLSTGNSTVILHNLSGSQQDINVEFFDQNGGFVDFITRTVPSMGEAQVATPTGPGGEFVGSALILGNGSFMVRGQWNFNVGAMPLAVGVPGMSVNDASTTFHIPVGTVGANSMVGVAINSVTASSADCTVTYRDSAGNAVSEDLFDDIPGFGQMSEFAQGITSGFEGSASISCSAPVAAVAVIQEQVNGFPTPLFACPAP